MQLDKELMRTIWWPYEHFSNTDQRGVSNSLKLRASVFCISVIGLLSCVVDKTSAPYMFDDQRNNSLQVQVHQLRETLIVAFKFVNLILLGATIMEYPTLVELYVWFTLSFVLLRLPIAIAELLFCFDKYGATTATCNFVLDLAFLFVLFRCLRLVADYGNSLRTYIEM